VNRRGHGASRRSRFWRGITGSVLIVTALVLLTTTYLTLRAGSGEDTTFTGDHVDRNGAGPTRADKV
jgi:hypothetical protein